MAVLVEYRGGEKVQITYGSLKSHAREKIISNLKAANVLFTDDGCDFFVDVKQFSSTKDFEEKVFSGFFALLSNSERTAREYQHKMEFFYYALVILDKKTKEQEELLEVLKQVDRHELIAKIRTLKTMIADASIDMPTKTNALKELQEKTEILRITHPSALDDLKDKVAEGFVNSKKLLDKHFSSNAPDDDSTPGFRM